MERIGILTGGGDCPGLNAVIRAIVRRTESEPEWEVIGSIEAFNGILRDPLQIDVERRVHVDGLRAGRQLLVLIRERFSDHVYEMRRF